MGLRIVLSIVIGLISGANGSSVTDYSKAILKANPKLTVQEARYISRKITKYSLANGLDPALVCAVVAVESGFRPMAVGSIGELGLMQLRPQFHATHIDNKMLRTEYLFDVQMNLHYGIQYLAKLKASFGSRYTRYRWLEKYNLGPNKKPVSFEYTKRVLKQYEKFKGLHDL